MAKFLVKRLGYLLFVLIIISIALFGISKLMPGDPALRLMDQRKLRPEQYAIKYEEARKKLGLDQPVPVQYLKWMVTMVTGDFGYSVQNKMPVKQMAKAPLLNTIKLNVFAILLTFLITIPLGVLSAVKKGKAPDQIAQVITILGYSLPEFVFGLIFICLFAVVWQIFPVGGTSSVDGTLTGFAKFRDDMKYLALPLLTYVFSSLGGITRYVRASMLEVLNLDYIRTARAKGVKERVVIWSHAFRNSLIPFVTIVTGWFLSVFSGSVVIERTFSYNGIGNVLITALTQQDFAVVLTFYMFYAVLTLAGNLIMDIGYSLVDPRVRLS
jgi:peptide/nickel transport system permease protein